jgi:hypothetical protein
MSRALQRMQRPAALRLLSTYGSLDNQDITSSGQTHRASETRSQSPGRITSSARVATTRASSPTSFITITGKSRTESAQQTVFVTITTTRRWYEGDEDKTPSPTKSIFSPTATQTIRITISDTPITTSVISSVTTAGVGSAQTQVGSLKSGSSPALSQPARVGLAVLGVICK